MGTQPEGGGDGCHSRQWTRAEVPHQQAAAVLRDFVTGCLDPKMCDAKYSHMDATQSQSCGTKCNARWMSQRCPKTCTVTWEVRDQSAQSNSPK